MLGLHFTPVCVLLLVCSLHFTLSLHFTPGPQSAVCSPQSAFYTDRFAECQTTLKFSVRFGSLHWKKKFKTDLKLDSLTSLTLITKLQSHLAFCVLQNSPANKSVSHIMICKSTMRQFNSYLKVAHGAVFEMEVLIPKLLKSLLLMDFLICH